MSAARQGVNVDQRTLVESEFFTPPQTSGHVAFSGGFYEEPLREALRKYAPVPNAEWAVVDLPGSTAADLVRHLPEYLAEAKGGIILRVQLNKHWVVVDSVLADGRFVIRDPGLSTSTVVTPVYLIMRAPTGTSVMSLGPSSPILTSPYVRPFR